MKEELANLKYKKENGDGFSGSSKAVIVSNEQISSGTSGSTAEVTDENVSKNNESKSGKFKIWTISKKKKKKKITKTKKNKKKNKKNKINK